jgi:hypothetical protein
MVTSQAVSEDTSSDARDVVIERLRSMSGVERLQMAVSLSSACEALATAGILHRHPGATAHEVVMRLGVLRNGRDLMAEAFGWDADVEGR